MNDNEGVYDDSTANGMAMRKIESLARENQLGVMVGLAKDIYRFAKNREVVAGVTIGALQRIAQGVQDPAQVVAGFTPRKRGRKVRAAL